MAVTRPTPAPADRSSLRGQAPGAGRLHRLPPPAASSPPPTRVKSPRSRVPPVRRSASDESGGRAGPRVHGALRAVGERTRPLSAVTAAPYRQDMKSPREITRRAGWSPALVAGLATAVYAGAVVGLAVLLARWLGLDLVAVPVVIAIRPLRAEDVRRWLRGRRRAPPFDGASTGPGGPAVLPGPRARRPGQDERARERPGAGRSSPAPVAPVRSRPSPTGSAQRIHSLVRSVSIRSVGAMWRR